VATCRALSSRSHKLCKIFVQVHPLQSRARGGPSGRPGNGLPLRVVPTHPYNLPISNRRGLPGPAVRPDVFHTLGAGKVTQLVVSAIADNPTTSHSAGPPPPQGADCLWPYNFVAFVYSLCKHMVYIAGMGFVVGVVAVA